MTQEALKLAIQLKDTASGYWTEHEIPIIEKLIEILARPEQEPVEMYRNKCADGSRCLHGCHTNEPCYTTPPQPEQEPMAWHEIVLNQKQFLEKMEWLLAKTATPPQRKPLTDEEMDNCLRRAGVIATLEALRCIGREVEAAHGIKENT